VESTCGVSSAVERYPSKLDVVGSIPILRSLSLRINNMSLISQRDREVAIAALEKYVADAENTEYYLGTPKHTPSEIYALLNWIRLEYFKHEN
jgi:hypothetical protein